MPEARQVARIIGSAAFVGMACYAGAAIGTSLRFPEIGTAILFPPYAILTVALLVSPPRLWWIYLFASSVGNFWPHRDGGAPISFVLMAEIANYARALVGAYGVRRFGDAEGRFDTLKGMTIFLLFGGVLGPLAGASMGAGVVALHHGAGSYWLAFRPWFLSNALTGLTLLPILRIGVSKMGAARKPLVLRAVLEGIAVSLSLLAVGFLILLQPSALGTGLPAPLYATLPLLLWAAVRFGPSGTSASILVVAAFAIWGTIGGRGPFVTRSPEEDLLHLQLFLFVISVPLLLLSALMQQQVRTAKALLASQREAEEHHRLLEAQRMLADALRENDRRKDEFLAVLSHELRNPLAPISMVVEILRRLPSPHERVRWAREIVARQVTQLTRLVDDLLDVSRISRGTIQVRMEAVDLGNIIANAIETSGPLLAGRNLELITEVPRTPLPMHGDQVRLAQLFSNLLNNATKYSQVGGRIYLNVETDGDRILVRVKDAGVGIPQDMLERVFEPFVQVDRPRDGALGGLGLGLALVKQLVRMHGGDVEARSDGRGLGSEFVVRLPARPSAGVEQPVSVPDPSESEPRPVAPRRILVVDDAIDAAETLAEFLTLQGHHVDVAHDGSTALDAALRSGPEVVFLDLELPKMGGLEVARRLRARYDSERMLLVATTGFGQAEDHRRTSEAGFDHHLTKPIDPSKVQALLNGGAAS